MGEMKKTTDSCILYGVPRIHFGMEEDGRFQATPFPMCFRTVLNYMGQDFGYTQAMVYSGAAFRMRWGIENGGWDLAAIDIRNIYETWEKPFRLAFKAAGRDYNVPDITDESMKKEIYLQFIKSELDCGRPVIALGVVGPPEACIITGYRKNGETLLGWSLFQGDVPFGGEHDIDETGYFSQDKWFENIEGIMAIGEDIGKGASVKEVLQNAYTLMTKENVTVYDGMFSYHGGQAAYEAWAKTIENDSFFSGENFKQEYGNCQNDAEMMLGEGRGYAAVYLNNLAETTPYSADELRHCAALIESAAVCAWKMQDPRGGWQVTDENMARFRDAKVRKRIAELIRQAAIYEKDACAKLKGIIDKI
ncbi:MAG: AraC family transcriptional regulator [Clostridiales bacterium]|jgi:hypothetical protein|nr:AraC family transcriptional regulator [Clostridiales bacterium]